MTEILLVAIVVLQIIAIVCVFTASKRAGDAAAEVYERKNAGEKGDADRNAALLRREVSDATASAVKSFGEVITTSQSAKFSDMQTMLSERLVQQEKRFGSFAYENEQKLENMRKTIENRLELIRGDNNKKLDEMRATVDEKLQKTLEEKMDRSFRLVSERLEQVYKGLGEMQNLAVGVGDLKKVLSNVKTRGVLGEIQLGAILEEILAREQYDVNVVTKKSSKAFVEFAIKLPSEDGTHVYLPIDSKFPADAYSDLRDAYDSGSAEAVTACWSVLSRRICSFAKDIRDKYIDPPATTEFAIMFLPFEGLYAEVVNRGMVEMLQRDYRINIAGPSTMAALLNSLQMGFKTFAIQQRSGEVWKVLGAVKTEFDTFADVLTRTQQRLEQANDELDKLVGVRTRQIRRKLKDVTQLADSDTVAVLGSSEEEEDLQDKILL